MSLLKQSVWRTNRFLSGLKVTLLAFQKKVAVFVWIFKLAYVFIIWPKINTWVLSIFYWKQKEPPSFLKRLNMTSLLSHRSGIIVFRGFFSKKGKKSIFRQFACGARVLRIGALCNYCWFFGGRERKALKLFHRGMLLYHHSRRSWACNGAFPSRPREIPPQKKESLKVFPFP